MSKLTLRETVKEFSTSEVARMFDVPRSTLQGLIDRNLIRPFIRANGLGSQSVFNRKDIYRMALFNQLRKFGLSHKYLPEIWSYDLEHEQECGCEYIVFSMDNNSLSTSWWTPLEREMFERHGNPAALIIVSLSELIDGVDSKIGTSWQMEEAS